MSRSLITISAIMILVGPLTAATYHVDSETGADASSGLTPGQAWKSLDRVNGRSSSLAMRFASRREHITPASSGHGIGAVDQGKAVPIVVGKYGEGLRPGSTVRAGSSTPCCFATSNTGRFRIWR